MLIGNRSVKVGFKRRGEAREVLAAVAKVTYLGAVCPLLVLKCGLAFGRWHLAFKFLETFFFVY